ncbi:hypothetical protein [Nonlabens sp.]|uniref:hypothetical protein n=1 Tax=Nonlabens sp. TaxID=1888209 RepID=UPI0032671059
MKKIFLFVLLTLLISCDDDSDEILTNVSSSTNYSEISVNKAKQLILEHNPFLIEESDGLFHLKNRVEKVPVVGEQTILSQQDIIGILMPNSSCGGTTYAGITYEGLNYDLYVTAQKRSSYARLVKVEFERLGYVFEVRTLTIPARSFHSISIPFDWITESNLGLINMNITKVTDLVPSDNSLFPDGFNRVDTTANYNSVPNPTNVESCRPSYNGVGDPSQITPPIGDAGGGSSSTISPCDCDGDGVINENDQDDNNNGIFDDEEEDFDGCNSLLLGCF